MPSFVSAALYEEDSLEQLVVDDSRNVLYSRSEKGVVQVFDLGVDGCGLGRVAAITQANIVQDALRVASNIDKSNFAPLVGISCIPASESVPLSLMAVSANGVRFYFSTSSGSSPLERPHGITLQHIRLPPGFSASSAVPRPTKVHMCHYKQGKVVKFFFHQSSFLGVTKTIPSCVKFAGTLLLSSAQSEDSDLLWLVSADGFPFQSILMEGQSTLQLHGRAWALDEVPQPSAAVRLYRESFGNQQPPLAVVQHAQSPRRYCT